MSSGCTATGKAAALKTYDGTRPTGCLEREREFPSAIGGRHCADPVYVGENGEARSSGTGAQLVPNAVFKGPHGDGVALIELSAYGVPHGHGHAACRFAGKMG